jgi:hypothetical protein
VVTVFLVKAVTVYGNTLANAGDKRSAFYMYNILLIPEIHRNQDT